MEKERRWQNCNSHSMNFELSSALQDTLDTWCLSPKSEELNGGLIIRRDRAGEYKLEPIVSPLSNIDPTLMFGEAWPDVCAGPHRPQARRLDMIREHRTAAIFEGSVPQDNLSLDLSEEQSMKSMDCCNDVVWNQPLSPWIEHEHRSSATEIHNDEAVFEDSSPQGNPSLGLSEEQSMDFHSYVVWNQELSPSIEKHHTASDIPIYLDGAAFEDTLPQDNSSIGYCEEWSVDRNDRIVVRKLDCEWIRQEQRSSDMDTAFHEAALNINSSNPFWSATKTDKAAQWDMFQPLPENSSLYLPVEQGMDIYKNVLWNHRASPWIKEDLRSSAMEIYFDEAVSEAYPLSPFRPSPRSNKSSLSYILQSPPFQEINDRSPPSSPTKPRYASPNKNINDLCGPVYFDEVMTDAYMPSSFMQAIETHMASLPYILQPPPAEAINDRSPTLSPRKPRETSLDENIDGGSEPVYFRLPPGHDYATGLTESKILSGRPSGDTSSTPQATKRKPGLPSGTSIKRKTLCAAQSKKIAATALKHIEALRKRAKAQIELSMTADLLEGNASKRRKRNRAELRSDHESEEHPRRWSGEFEKRINVLGRIAGDEKRKGWQYGAEDEENDENCERLAYDPDL